MEKVLMIADDLTGALDAGVAFAKAGITTCVGQGDYFLRSSDAEKCAVQVTVVPSRHMSAKDAYRSVYDVVEKASDSGFTCIFKKTDSALRGNVGAELAAARDASGEKTMFFVPAFPKMNRVTKGGIQYIDGSIPVAESVFGRDPFNPVQHSYIPEILAETTDTPSYQAEGETRPGIAVYDGGTEEEVLAVARQIFHRDSAKLVAGCAGLADAVPKVLELKRIRGMTDRPREKLLVFCGSVNPISLAQCAYAEAQGAPRFHLIHGKDFSDEEVLARQMAEAAKEHNITVFDTGSDDVDASCAVESGRVIAEKVSKVIGGVTREVPDATVFVIGGDTLLAFINSLGIETIIPVEEFFPGVVLAKYHIQGEWRYLIAKSGGFGEPDLLEKISLKLSSSGEMKEAGGA